MSRTAVIAACALSFTAGIGATRFHQAQATTRVPQFENDNVSAWKSIIMPGAPLTQHRHEHGRALIALTDGQVKTVDQNGKTITTYTWEKGKAYWLDKDPPVQTHADVNTTSKPIEVIVVQLKNDR